MAKSDLTANRLRELLKYDSETGSFTWIVCRGKANSSKNAGWIRKETGPHAARRVIEVDQQNHFAHRLAWLYVHGDWPIGVIDHINGNTLDNRIQNLRDVSQRINQQNRRKTSSRSGLLGAHWRERDKKWSSAIVVGGKAIHLGIFETAETAHAAYVAAKRKLHEGCTI